MVVGEHFRKVEVLGKCYLCFKCLDIEQSLGAVVRDHLVTFEHRNICMDIEYKCVAPTFWKN